MSSGRVAGVLGVTPPAIPRAGLLAHVRNRHGVIVAVTPFDGENGRLHLVDVEYKDARQPATERLLWELEAVREVVEPTAVPDATRGPMPVADFDALLRAARWSALSPYLTPDGASATDAIASPFHGAVQVENYQLHPLLQALRMPRMNMLIADDVGLGKTIEAGLILTELLLRRRIRRVLVLTPASLRNQWRDELWDKFALRFEIVDRTATARLRRQLGMDANPWRSFSRIIASYHYLRQPDVREQFLASCRSPEGSPHLPWDLLIVDECHHLMPSPFGEDSELCRTLRLVAPQFEHRLFLSATPHNGHTRCFTGLLEMLDPVRFSRTSEMTTAMRERIQQVVVRRLKRDVDAAAATPRFCRRHPPRAIELAENAFEIALADAFDRFRAAIRELVGRQAKQTRNAGHFAVEILGKRLLSCPTAFAESWRRARQGLHEDSAASATTLSTAERAYRQETGDDRETEQRAATAATVTGAWLKNFAANLRTEIGDVERALAALGFDLDGLPTTEQTPHVDARFDELTALVDRLLFSSEGASEGERLIVFTEYKTTLDYLARRLRERHPPECVLTLFGAGGTQGMDATDREQVRTAFNDPASPVRVLVATDAASEGLNLHRTARYLLHYDCPWNPSRLEQRNGRIDRYGQGRDVTVHHFVSNAQPDLRFLDHVIRKAHEIREDLGSLNEIFDAAVYRRLIQGENAATVQAALDAGLEAARDTARIDADAAAPSETHQLTRFAEELDFNAAAQRDTLEAALATAGESQQLLEAEDVGFYRLRRPDLPGWRDVVDESLRVPPNDGPVPRLAFSAASFMHKVGHLEVYLPPPDAALMHLAHPLMRRALGVLARRRYPGEQQVSRWTVRRGGVPTGEDAAILLSVEELAVNELRETFHNTVRTVAFALRAGILGDPLPAGSLSANPLAERAESLPEADIERGGALLEDAQADLRAWLRRHQEWLTRRLGDRLRADGEAARQREGERYRQRRGEISALIEKTTTTRLSRELEHLAQRRRQGQLFDADDQLAQIERSMEEKEAELRRRKRHWEELREQLESERRRLLESVLPKRFALAGEAQVFPVAVEVRLT